MLPKQYKCKGFRFNISIPLFLDHVITYLACLRVHVQTCLACLSAHVLTCLACLSAHVPTYLPCLRAHVPTCLACLHAYDPICLAWYVLTCQPTLHLWVLTCLTCQHDLRAYTCQSGLWAHMFTYQHALSPLSHIACMTTWSPASMPCLFSK